MYNIYCGHLHGAKQCYSKPGREVSLFSFQRWGNWRSATVDAQLMHFDHSWCVLTMFQTHPSVSKFIFLPATVFWVLISALRKCSSLFYQNSQLRMCADTSTQGVERRLNQQFRTRVTLESWWLVTCELTEKVDCRWIVRFLVWMPE